MSKNILNLLDIDELFEPALTSDFDYVGSRVLGRCKIHTYRLAEYKLKVGEYHDGVVMGTLTCTQSGGCWICEPDSAPGRANSKAEELSSALAEKIQEVFGRYVVTA